MGDPAPLQKVRHFIMIESPPRARAAVVTLMERGQSHAPGGAQTLHFRRADFPADFFDLQSDYVLTLEKRPRTPDNPEQETAA